VLSGFQMTRQQAYAQLLGDGKGLRIHGHTTAGSGGMGEVYLAKHPRLPRQDALKVLPAGMAAEWRDAGDDRVGVRKTATEAKSVQALTAKARGGGSRGRDFLFCVVDRASATHIHLARIGPFGTYRLLRRTSGSEFSYELRKHLYTLLGLRSGCEW
jgi:hypothetical protein